MHRGFEEVQFRKMESSFISKYFKHIITSERVGVKKPNPAIFNFAMELSGAKSSESIMIGDNFEADILGAKSVGMETVFCDFNGEFPLLQLPVLEHANAALCCVLFEQLDYGMNTFPGFHHLQQYHLHLIFLA